MMENAEVAPKKKRSAASGRLYRKSLLEQAWAAKIQADTSLEDTVCSPPRAARINRLSPLTPHYRAVAAPSMLLESSGGSESQSKSNTSKKRKAPDSPHDDQEASEVQPPTKRHKVNDAENGALWTVYMTAKAGIELVGGFLLRHFGFSSPPSTSDNVAHKPKTAHSRDTRNGAITTPPSSTIRAPAAAASAIARRTTPQRAPQYPAAPVSLLRSNPQSFMSRHPGLALKIEAAHKARLAKLVEEYHLTKDARQMTLPSRPVADEHIDQGATVKRCKGNTAQSCQPEADEVTDAAIAGKIPEQSLQPFPTVIKDCEKLQIEHDGGGRVYNYSSAMSLDGSEYYGTRFTVGDTQQQSGDPSFGQHALPTFAPSLLNSPISTSANKAASIPAKPKKIKKAKVPGKGRR